VNKYYMILAVTTASPMVAVAQTTISGPPPVAATLPAPSAVQTVQMAAPDVTVLRTGTPISLRMLEGITTKNKVAKINDRVRMEVAEAVKINDVVVIPAGSPAVGELTDVRYKGMWGKSGRIVGRALTVNANGRTIRLSGTFDDKGGSGTVGAVAVSAIVFLPAGFFMTGKSAEFTPGTVVRAFIDEDIPLTIVRDAAPQPMVVGKQ
jgi:hypothetical protein